jgi:hypothetical protein
MCKCSVCGKDGLLLSSRNVPESGPLDIPGTTVHRINGAAVYHCNPDANTHGTRLYP